MSRPRFLADEDLRGSIVRAVRRRNPSLVISTIREQNHLSATDEEVLEFAWQSRWLLISHDVNTMKAFAEQRIANGLGMHGLFLIHQKQPISRVSDCLNLIAEASEFEEWRDRIVFLPF